MSALAETWAYDAISDRDAEKHLFDIDAEQALLGLLITNNSAFKMHCQTLSAEHFYEPIHSRIYGRIKAEIEDGNEVSPMTLKAFFSSDASIVELGGTDYLSFLFSNAPLASMAQPAVSVIKDMYVRREVKGICQIGQSKALRFDNGTEQTGFDLANSVIERVSAIQRVGAKQDTLAQISDAVQSLYFSPLPETISTGIERLDDLCPLPRNGLTLLGGQTSMGKTMLAVQLAYNAAFEGKRVMIFSLEMGKEQIASRMSSLHMDATGGGIGEPIPYMAISRRMLSQVRMERAIDAGRALPPMQIDDRSGLTVSEIKAAVYSQREMPDLIVVDYLNIMSLDDMSGDRHDQKMGAAASRLRDFAKETGAAVLLLCQLNRQNVRRDSTVPQISDLKDSGALEQIADLIMFTHRPHYYESRKIEAREANGDQISNQEYDELYMMQNDFSVIVAKQRMGATGHVKLHGNIKTNYVRSK